MCNVSRYRSKYREMDLYGWMKTVTHKVGEYMELKCPKSYHCLESDKSNILECKKTRII